MKYLAYFLLIVLLLALNVGFFAHITIRGATVDLLLLLTVLVSLQKEFSPYLFVAVVSGLFLDCYTGLFFGSFLLSFLLASFLIRLIAQQVVMYELNWKYVFLVLAGAIFFIDVFVWGYNVAAVHYNLGTFEFGFEVVRSHFIPEFVYSAALLYPVYILMTAVNVGLLELERNRKFR